MQRRSREKTRLIFVATHHQARVREQLYGTLLKKGGK